MAKGFRERFILTRLYRDEKEVKILFLIILHNACATAEQVFFKHSVNTLADRPRNSLRDYRIFFIDIFRNPFVWLGFLMTLSSWLIWFVVLSKIDVSMAVPLDSMQHLMILAAAYFFLKERITWSRLVGILFVLSGVLCVARS